MINSTSVHRINNDLGLSRFEKICWWIINWLNNNILPNRIDSSLKVRNFIFENLAKNWNNPQLFIDSSPARKLCDLFLLYFPWTKIDRSFSGINILDTGCGEGNYFSRINYHTGNIINSYVGFDIEKKENWQSIMINNDNVKFYQLDNFNFNFDIPKNINLFLSISAIEHFSDDLIYFKKIYKHIHNTENQVIQIHLFPSRASLSLQGLHGVRQYNQRTVSRITRLFNNNSYSVLFNLGGKNCNKIHKKFITKPISGLFYRIQRKLIDFRLINKKKIYDMRDIYPKQYDKDLFKAIELDQKCDQNTDPTYYALFIHSNYKENIF